MDTATPEEIAEARSVMTARGAIVVKRNDQTRHRITSGWVELGKGRRPNRVVVELDCRETVALDRFKRFYCLPTPDEGETKDDGTG